MLHEENEPRKRESLEYLRKNTALWYDVSMARSQKKFFNLDWQEPLPIRAVAGGWQISYGSDRRVRWDQLERHRIQSDGRPFVLWHLTLAGHCLWEAEGDSCTWSAGDLAVIPVPSPSEYRLPPSWHWETIWLRFEGEAMVQWAESWLHRYGYISSLSLKGSFVSQFKTLIQQGNDGRAHGSMEATKVSERVYGLMMALEREMVPRDDEPLMRAKALLSQLCGDPDFSIETLAEESGLSRAHFTRQFKLSFGTTPKQYLVQQRMQLAQEWLTRGEDSVKKVAEACGYRHDSLFIATFKKFYGCTPREWLQRQA